MTTTIRRIVALGVAGAWAAAACSSNNTTKVVQVLPGSDGGLPGLSPERVPQVEAIRAQLRPIAEAQCTNWFACCTEGERAIQTGRVMKDAAGCADVLVQMAEYGTTSSGYYGNPMPTALFVLKYLEYDFDFSKVSLDTASIAACAKSLSAAPCNAPRPADHCVPDPPPAGDDPCAPSKLFVGHGKEGDECVRTLQFSTSVDCAPGLSCVSVDAIHAVCTAAPEGGLLCGQDYDCRDSAMVCDHTSGRCVDGLDLGAPCTYADLTHPVVGTETTPCRSGLICDTQKFTCADATCASGTSCSQDRDCAAGLLCVGNVCGPLGVAGKNCNADAQCESHLCRSPPSGGNAVCVAPKAEGASCESDSECATQFCTSTGMAAVCTKQANPGDPCPSASDSQCAGGHCTQNSVSVYTCVATGAAGDTCTIPSDCDTKTGLSCVKGTCQMPPFADGSPCPTGTDDICASKFCDGTNCRARAKVAEACSNSHSPAGDPPCEDTLYCDYADASLPSGLCRARKAAGDSCTADSECPSSCQPIAGTLRCIDYSQRRVLCTGPGAK